MRFFSVLLATITNHDRYAPEIIWSDRSWTHNFFRAYEYVFGRKIGIRAEMSVSSCVEESGKQTIFYRCHSWESVFALAETRIREFLSTWKFVPFRIYIPVLQANGVQFQSPYLFAIAFDAATQQRTSTSLTNSFSATVTGSNMFLIGNNSDYSGTSPANSVATYNLVSLTFIDGVLSTNPSGQNRMTMLGLVAPATGSNTYLATRLAATSNFNCHVASYSGAAQTGQPDNHTTMTVGGSVTSFTMSLTPVANNCWVFMFAFSENGGIASGTNSTLRGLVLNTVSGIWDNNAPISPAISTSLNVTTLAGFGMEGVMCSIAPAGGSATTTTYKSLLGVGH